MNALLKIRDAGFAISLSGDSFAISPASELTTSQRDFLKYHRAKIIEELRTEVQPLSANYRQKLLEYLDAISETDQALIDEYLTECGKDAAILARELQQADDCLQLKTGNTTGLVQCSGCQLLSGDTCQFHGWRVVADKWRRCEAYHPTSCLKNH